MKPIIFSTPMVRAILEGKKTQTRRVVKGVSEDTKSIVLLPEGQRYEDSVCGQRRRIISPRTPYQPGDVLWVRETWAHSVDCGHLNHLHETKIIYRADNRCEPDRWRPSIHMPRWAARLFLRVTNVRCERVQEISEADALAEGFRPSENWNQAKWAFRETWDSLNAKRGYGWDVNPWVWVYEFERVEE